VRTRTRQPLKAFDSSNSNEENENNSELDQEIPIGKLEKSKSATAKSNNNNNNHEINKNEEEINVENSSSTTPTSSLRSGSNFKPRFGARQRNAVRTRLKQQLFESKEGIKDEEEDKTEEEVVDDQGEHNGDDLITNDIPDHDEDEDLTIGFGTTVSSIFGLNAVPATAHFTTTPRFILGGHVPTSTPSPSLQSKDNQAFLPTLSPLQRVGRSTIGYVDPVQPTEKPTRHISTFPKSLKPKRGSRPKFGQKFSTTSSPFEDNIAEVGRNIIYGISSTVLPTTTTESTNHNNGSSVDSATSSINATKPRSTKKRKNNKADGGGGGKSLFARPRVDFLKRFNQKIADIERKEKALLESFGGGNTAQKFANSKNKKQPKQQEQDNNSSKNGNKNNNNNVVIVNKNRISGGINLKRPRRKLTNAGLNEVNDQEKTEENNKFNDNDDVIELKYNITLKTAETSKDFANSESNTNNDLTGKNNKNQKSKPTKSFKKPSALAPSSLPPLPKGFQFPFSKNRFGKHQPKLLSFQIIKSKPDQDHQGKKKEPLKIENDEEDADEQGKNTSITKKLSLRDKLKFGRKSFGSLLKQPKKPFFPTPAPPKHNTSTTTPDH
jgi:hypothetical protein